MEIIHEEVQTIVENGPLPEDLQKEKESMTKEFQVNLEENNFWRNTLNRYYLYGENRIRDYQSTLDAVTVESVQALLKQLVASGNVMEVVMFPE